VTSQLFVERNWWKGWCPLSFLTKHFFYFLQPKFCITLIFLENAANKVLILVWKNFAEIALLLTKLFGPTEESTFLWLKIKKSTTNMPWFYVTGSHRRKIADFIRIDVAIASRIVEKVFEVVASLRLHYIKMLCRLEELVKARNTFFK